MSRRSVRVVSVEPDGIAARSGVREGDRVLAVSGEPLDDSLDFELLANEPVVPLTLERDGERHEALLERQWGETLGLSVSHRPRTCRLRCRFCFVDQQPAGTRASLCLKDDDYALSFRDGNFVTLSNLDQDDLDRIVGMELSPLYVSVHATDPEVRERLLRPRSAIGRDVMPLLEGLVEHDIVLHAQIVLAPGFNDGETLERSLRELTVLAPGVRSVAVVPIGLTRYQSDSELRGWDAAGARVVLDRVAPWRERMRAAHGVPVVTPSDEWYLLVGDEPPPAADYDGYPQIENGVGLLRSFLDEMEAASELPAPNLSGQRIVLATGRLARPALQRAADAMAGATGAEVSVHVVDSVFWGSTVTVVGLLTGQDLADGLRDVKADRILLPDVVVNSDGRFLDDRDLGWLRSQLKSPLELVPASYAGLLS